MRRCNDAPHKGRQYHPVRRAVERSRAAKRQIAIRALEPSEPCRFIGKEQLQAIVNTEQERDPFKLIAAQGANFAPLPIVIRWPGNVANSAKR